MTSTMSVESSVVIKASLERVWQAITDPEQFGQWFECKLHFAHLAENETMTFTFGDIVGYGRIAAVEPLRRFAYYWTPELNCPVETLVTITLETTSEGTLVRMSETGFEALPEAVRQNRLKLNGEGWSIQTQNLAAYMEAVLHA